MSEEKTGPGAIILGWWGQSIAMRNSGAARALASRLRRDTAIEILCEPAVHELARKLGLNSHHRAEQLLRIVRVLAEFRENSADTLARRLGGAEPVLSNARFQRLMRSEGEALTIGLIRAARMLGPAETRRCHIARLGEDLWFWDDRTRMRWSFEYFHVPAPDARPSIPTEIEA